MRPHIFNTMIHFLKYLMALTTGLLLGYWLFFDQSTNTPNVSVQQRNTIAQLQAAKIQNENKTDNIASTELLALKTRIQSLSETIQTQKKTIETLTSKLEQPQTVTNSLAEKTQEPVKEEKGMEVLSMEDFESRLKADFTDRFKGLAIEISGQQLESVKNAYERDSGKSEWSVDFENKVIDFINQADPNNMHYVDEVGCNKSMCRLKVLSGENSQWQNIYSNMTKQNWYNSMTLVEKSNDASSFVYYIPNPNSM